MNTMKKHNWILLLLMVFSINFHEVKGQVNATFDETYGTLTIENYSNRPFLIFSNSAIRNELFQNGNFQFSPEEMEIKPCGVAFPKNYEVIKGKKVFNNLKTAPKTFIFYYYEGDSLMLIKASDKREITVEVTKIEKPETPKTKPKKPEPKKEKPKVIINPYTDKVNDFIAKNNLFLQGKKDLDNQERVILQNQKHEANLLKKEIESYIDTIREKKKKSKQKCEDCDILIKSSNTLCINLEKLSRQIVNLLKNVSDKEVLSLKTDFWNLVIQPTFAADSIALLQIKEEIAKKSQNSLWGWTGIDKLNNRLKEVEEHYNKILLETKIFIFQKQNNYDNENDKAVIEDLENDIPELYNEIYFLKDTLSRIETPVAKLSGLSVVLVLLLFGVIFYVRTILKNRRIKKVVHEQKHAPERGLLVEEDILIEVKTYSVDMSDIKENTGTNYLKINMLDIVEDSTIRNVFLSREAIVFIYKYFSDFLKFHGTTNETGCFLTGRWEFVPDTHNQMYDISIEAIVEPGDDAVYGEYNLNFGAKIGITLNYAIENLCEKSDKEYVHTAWMHTHPGMGLFLSNQDLSVQSQLAHSQHPGRLLAIVMDTKTPHLEMAFFTPQKTGTMNNDINLKRKLSLEEIYKWAKTPPKKSKSNKSKNN